MKTIRASFALIIASAAAACSSPPDAADETAVADDDLRTGIVRVYAEGSFGGDKQSLTVGDHDLVSTPWNDAIGSLRIFGDYQVELFADGGFRGASRIVTADAATLGALDGKVSSLRIRAKGTVPTPPPTGNPPPVPTGNPSPPPAAALVGWASVTALGQSGTTGGASGPTVTVKTLADLNARAAGTSPAIIQVAAALTGDVTVGSNKTIVGVSGGSIHGHIEMKGSVNVIVRNLEVVGNNCADDADCQSGEDAITVTKNAHHLWFDHCAISNGSDGNLDITHASDYVTISWTKFSYSGKRPGGHQFSNLIGHTDSNPEDEGHLKVTFHHDWWADNVDERMPRVRYGQVHAFNNLFTSAGNNYCFRAGVQARILSEGNAFIGVSTPFDLGGGDVLSRGDLFVKTTGNTAGTGKAFAPGYTYVVDPSASVEAAVRAGAGVH
jgi:pectate lyase